MSSGLIVYFGKVIAGRLWLDRKRRFNFQYDEHWLGRKNLIPLSLSLPLQSEPFTDDLSRPFFSNLLPEAELRRAIARSLGLSEGNDYALLEAIGGECAGAVSLLPEGVPPVKCGEYRFLDDNTLNEIIKSLPTKPFLAGEEGVRLSLAGVQSKLPVYLKNEKIYLPVGSKASSHIIKPAIRDFSSTVENEAFCMGLAKKMGLSVPDSRIYRSMTPLYLVERYDRICSDIGEIVRIHQEDICQALGIPPEAKYESEGGPSLEDCFSILRKFSTRPAADIKELINWVIFNYLIGNADAHAKNLSLLFIDEGIRLAPFYDLLCTRVYDGLTDRFSMKIGGENRPHWIQLRHWQRLAQAAVVKERLIFEMLKKMSQTIVNMSEVLGREFKDCYGENDTVIQIIDVIRDRSRRLESLFLL